MSLEEKYLEIERTIGIPRFKLKEMSLEELEKIIRALINTGQITIKI